MATAPCGAPQNNLTLDEIIYPIFDDFSHFWCFYSKWNIKYEERERMLSMIYEFFIANHFSFRQFLLHIFCVLAAFLLLTPSEFYWIGIFTMVLRRRKEAKRSRRCTRIAQLITFTDFDSLDLCAPILRTKQNWLLRQRVRTFLRVLPFIFN